MRPLQAAWIGASLFTLVFGCSSSGARYDAAPMPLAGDVSWPRNGVRLLSTQATVGRFPCSVAIARVQAEGDGWRIVDTSHAEQGHWVEALSCGKALRDQQFLTTRHTCSPTTDAERLTRRARESGAALLLVYSRSLTGPRDAEMSGMIYDAQSGARLAVLHASNLAIDADGLPPGGDSERSEREAAASFQARRNFERAVRSVIADLARGDSPSSQIQEHHWNTPLEERWWLPDKRH